MKSVKMMSALAALLSLGTAACQMPVEHDDALLEHDAETLLAATESADECVSPFRATMEASNGHAYMSWNDSCFGEDYALSAAVQAIQSGDDRAPLEGEVYSGSNAFRALGVVVLEEGGTGYLSLELLHQEEVIGSLSGDFVADPASETESLDFEGKTVWRR